MTTATACSCGTPNGPGVHDEPPHPCIIPTPAVVLDEIEAVRVQREQARALAARFVVEVLVLTEALRDALDAARGRVTGDPAEALLRNAERVLDDLVAGGGE